ncbi:MAG: prepilin peptidase [Victivallales bacterium]|jgi:leader peptidase (prepilin peptidase)/N-methyltransferase|nr:prepilin peptidase [Victivallales bacterium]
MLNGFLRLTDQAAYIWWSRAGFGDDYVLCFFVVSSFLLGSCLGSFLNVCIWRMPLNQSIVTAPSHCPKCDTPIRWFDNIPILSFLLLHGRCRYCKATISKRYIFVEGLTGILFALLLVKIGVVQQPPLTLLAYYTMTMLCISTIWIDFEHRLIPDVTTYPAMIFGLAISAAFPSIWGVDNHLTSFGMALISGVISGGVLSLFAIIGQSIVRKEVLGWGDVKYMAAVGILLGIPGAVFTLLFGSFSGSIYGICGALYSGKKLAKVAIPLGPFLAFGSFIWMFAGEKILRWYLGFFSA